MELWHDIKQGVKHVLWCDGLKESSTVNASKTRKRSKKKNDSESDSDEDVETVTNKKKKQYRKDEKLEEVVGELKAQHGQQYTPMQYRIWGEMIIGGLYSSKTECPSTSMFVRAGGNQPKKKSDVAEALSEVAKHVSAAFSGAVPLGRSASGTTASPAKSIDNRSKCYKKLGELNSLKSAGVLTEDEYQCEKEAIMATLKKL